MGVIRKHIFLHLLDKEHPSEIGRGTRIILALIISFVFLSSTLLLAFFAITASGKGMEKRLAGGGLALIMGLYYLRLLFAMRKGRVKEDSLKKGG